MAKIHFPELFSAVRANPKNRYIFSGLFAFFCILAWSLIRSGLLPWGINQLWPVLVFFCGLSLLLAGLYHRKKPGLSYLVPAVVLMVLGPVFLLFSFHIIPYRLRSFMADHWFLVLFSLATVLVVLFLCRKQVAPAVVAVTVTDDDDDADTPGDV
jgi:uncharacterized membrane protein YoaK (UPF0700 family)